jgi:lipopolysaccharide transport system ATP-binding protein
MSRAAGAPLRAARAIFRSSRDQRPARSREIIWALKDINFEVAQGDVVGIIGRNGAGKSTLLKILSMITEPTEGSAVIEGRVGSLLEVGTGFHPELTGRENVFLNGAILGMRRAEIESKFDEIVAFAEVEKFIDTPVKHYSSGMYLRLAFSVAAHLEPEILLVDEVLAVGDIAFQKKCMGKMGDVARQGRTVLFVSHNLGMVKELCRTGIILKDGKIDFMGPVAQGIAHYSQAVISINTDEMVGGSIPRWRQVLVNGCGSHEPATVEGAEPFSVEALLETPATWNRGRLYCRLYDATGDLLMLRKIESSELGMANLAPGLYRIKVDFPPLWLAPGVYTLLLKFVGRNASGDERGFKSEPVRLDVAGTDDSKGRAVLAPKLDWSLNVESLIERGESNILSVGMPRKADRLGIFGS